MSHSSALIKLFQVLFYLQTDYKTKLHQEREICANDKLKPQEGL